MPLLCCNGLVHSSDEKMRFGSVAAPPATDTFYLAALFNQSPLSTRIFLFTPTIQVKVRLLRGSVSLQCVPIGG